MAAPNGLTATKDVPIVEVSVIPVARISPGTIRKRRSPGTRNSPAEPPDQDAADQGRNRGELAHCLFFRGFLAARAARLLSCGRQNSPCSVAKSFSIRGSEIRYQRVWLSRR